MSALATNAAEAANPVVAAAIAVATPYFDAAAWKYFYDHQNDSRRLFGIFTVRLSMFKWVFLDLAGADPGPPTAAQGTTT